MKDILFSAVVILVCADGIVLLANPAVHAILVNRWNALLGNPNRISVETYRRRAWMWRITGLAMTVTCVYILLKSWGLG